ncbi:MAG TPA: PH domain-containing protein [Actinomycetota bacterium]|nr:PH domain-containing protein [Actinomycetota bacterium]
MPEPQASESPGSDPGHLEAGPEDRRKLRPAAVPIWFLYDASRALLGLVPALVVGGGLSPILVVVALVLLIGPAIRYSRFRYGIAGNTLVVEGGLFNRWRRVLPRERVQSIDVVQKLRHRAFGVVELRIEAVGGTQTEAALVALLPEEADRVRRWAAGDGQLAGPGQAGTVEPALARLSGRDLLLAGVTGGRVAVLAALLGYGQELLGENSFDRVAALAGRLLPGASLVVVVSLLAVTALTVSLVLSIALTILVYWEFTLRLQESRLVITRGLLERRTAHIPLRRIQAVQVDENFLRRWLGMASLTVVVAGYSAEAQENQENSVLLPLGTIQKAWEVAGSVLGGPDLSQVPLPRPPGRAVIRRCMVPALAGMLAGAVGFMAAGPPGGAAAAIAPVGCLYAWLSWRSSGNAVVPGFVLVRAGVLVRRTSIVPEANLQHLQLTWSVFQRWFGLATIRLHIPGSLRRASDLDAGVAADWFRRLADGPPAG